MVECDKCKRRLFGPTTYENMKHPNKPGEDPWDYFSFSWKLERWIYQKRIKKLKKQRDEARDVYRTESKRRY